MLWMRSKGRCIMDIVITADDFEMLTSTQMEWGNVFGEDRLERFELDFKPDFKYIFWVESAASMILARQFLLEEGHRFYKSFDSVAGEYVLFTDYAASWDKVSA